MRARVAMRVNRWAAIATRVGCQQRSRLVQFFEPVSIVLRKYLYEFTRIFYHLLDRDTRF